MNEKEKAEMLAMLMAAWDFLRVKGRGDAEVKARAIVEMADAIRRRPYEPPEERS